MRKTVALFLMIVVVSGTSAFEVKILDEVSPTSLARWPASSIPVNYVVDSKGSDDLSFNKTLAGIQDAFNSWQNISKQTMRFTFQGSRTPATLNCSDHVNSLVWVEQNWQHSTFVLAVTKSTFIFTDPPEVVDADIIFNGVNFRWGDHQEKGVVPVEFVARHEIGHMIGLQHSQVKGATMLPFGDSAPTLSPDEKAGIRFLYPAQSVDRLKTLSPPPRVKILDDPDSTFPPVTFRWSAPSGSSNFVLEFSRFNTFTPPSKVRTFGAGNSLTFLETEGMRKQLRKLAGTNQKLFWRVRSDSPAGPEISKTAAFFFE